MVGSAICQQQIINELSVAYIAVDRDHNFILRKHFPDIADYVRNKAFPVLFVEIDDDIEGDPFPLLIDIKAVKLKDMLSRIVAMSFCEPRS